MWSNVWNQIHPRFSSGWRQEMEGGNEALSGTVGCSDRTAFIKLDGSQQVTRYETKESNSTENRHRPIHKYNISIQLMHHLITCKDQTWLDLFFFFREIITNCVCSLTQLQQWDLQSDTRIRIMHHACRVPLLLEMREDGRGSPWLCVVMARCVIIQSRLTNCCRCKRDGGKWAWREVRGMRQWCSMPNLRLCRFRAITWQYFFGLPFYLSVDMQKPCSPAVCAVHCLAQSERMNSAAAAWINGTQGCKATVWIRHLVCTAKSPAGRGGG